MHLDRRFAVVMLVSLGWALVVSAVFYKVAGAGAGRARPAAQKPVVVATKSLGVGQVLDRASVALRSMPENLFPAGAFSRVEDVLERSVISPIQADEPVVEARVAVKGSGLGLGPLIPPGMRAISVRVNDVVGVAGFVLPGMRVDVLVTGKAPGHNDTETQTVLQNITVLSAGQTIQPDSKSQPIVTPVVTLLVTPVEAEALTLANNEGHIQLVLRNSTDQIAVATRGQKLNDLYGNSPAPALAASDEPSPPVRRAAVRPAAPRVTPPEMPVALVPVLAPIPAPDEMMIIRGPVKKVEVFGKEPEVK